MPLLYGNSQGGYIYDLHNMAIFAKRISAMIAMGLLCGVDYDMCAAQTGISGILEGERIAQVYGYAPKCLSEIRHTYSSVQALPACAASFVIAPTMWHPGYACV
jgi:solute carrier family 20 (sodium-dependent phosphate transporter)